MSFEKAAVLVEIVEKLRNLIIAYFADPKIGLPDDILRNKTVVSTPRLERTTVVPRYKMGVVQA